MCLHGSIPSENLGNQPNSERSCQPAHESLVSLFFTFLTHWKEKSMKLTLGRSGWLALVAAMATLAPAGTTLGATYTWLGNGAGTATTGSWFTSGNLSNNWSPSGVPLPSGQDLEFDFTGVNTTAVQNGVASVQNITFVAGSGTIAGSSALTVTGNITNSSGVAQRIGASGALNLNGTHTIDVGTGGLTITKAFAGAGTVNMAGSGTLTLGNSIGFTGLVSNTSNTPVVGTGNFTGSYLQTGGTSSFAGTLAGSGTVNLSGGQLSADQTGGLVTQTGGTLIVNNLQFGVNLSAGTVTGTNGFVNIADDSTISGGKIFLNSTSGAGTDLVQTGGEIVYVFDPVLASPATISGSATLGGINTLADGKDGLVAFNGGLTMTSGNTWNLDFSKTPGDNALIEVTGDLVWGGALALNLTSAGTAANGSTWDFFDWTGSQSGDLSGITLSSTSEPAYAGLTFISATSSSNIFDQRYGAGVWLSDWTAGNQRFIFNQADGVLTVVPEPSTIVFAGIGAAMLGWQTWAGRRRKARMKLIDEHTRKLSEQRGLV